MRARSLSFPASLSWIPGVLQQQANKAWREKEKASKTNCRQFQGRRKKEERPADGRASGPCASAPSSSDREPVKKGSKSWSTPVCDCLEKETKTVILSDNSNERELRARSDGATTTRCRSRKEKLLRLRHGTPLVSKIMHPEDQVKSESRGAVHVNACRGLMRRVLHVFLLHVFLVACSRLIDISADSRCEGQPCSTRTRKCPKKIWKG